MKRIERNAILLTSLAKAPKAMQRSMIGKAPPDLIDALGECVLNILNGNIKINNATKKKLKKHKKNLRKVALKSVGRNIKRKIFAQQKGGFLSLIAPIIASLAAPLIKPVVGAILGH